MIRRARFAFEWYPGDPGKLRSALESYVDRSEAPVTALGVAAPHAGYVYSGAVAGSVYGRVRIPDTVVVLCVNHRGLGARAAILSDGEWETPLGNVPIDSGFAELLRGHAPLLEEDARAHSAEHSLEMQVPFLKYLNPGVRLVPVCLERLSYTECEDLGRALARSAGETADPVLLVASTDMSHFEPEERARSLDMLAIERIRQLDPRGLYDTVRKQRISMCGVVPTTVVLAACRGLGATRATLVRYATSGDITGDHGSVVGYAGVVLQ